MKKKIIISLISVFTFSIAVSALVIIEHINHMGVSVYPSIRNNSSWISEDGRLLLISDYYSGDAGTMGLLAFDENIENPRAYHVGFRGRVISIFDEKDPSNNEADYFRKVWSIIVANDDVFIVDVKGNEITKENKVKFNRIRSFSLDEYSSEIELYALTYDDESVKVSAQTPCEAVKLAISAWESNKLLYEDNILPPYTVLYDSQNECWLVKSSYRAINIFGKEAFPTDSYSAIIRKSDGKVLCSWVDSH